MATERNMKAAIRVRFPISQPLQNKNARLRRSKPGDGVGPPWISSSLWN